MRESLLILFILITSALRAECYYTTQSLTLEVRTETEQFVGYLEVSACDLNLDSVATDGYLLNALSKDGKLHYFGGRIEYFYCTLPESECPDDERIPRFMYFNRDSIAVDKVQNVRLADLTSLDSWTGIVSQHTLADTTWLHGTPLEVYDLGAGRCSARISIYRSFDELTSLNAEREQLQADLEQWYDEDESLEREDELLGQLEALLQRYIRHERVVVVYGCSD
jgi:hypothetical protein